MPFTDQQIREKALALEAAGKSPDTIRKFVTAAKAEQGAAAPAGAPAAQGEFAGSAAPSAVTGMSEAPESEPRTTLLGAPFGPPTTAERVAGVVFPPAAAISYASRYPVAAAKVAPMIGAVLAPPSLLGYLTAAGIGGASKAVERGLEGGEVMSRKGAADVAGAAVRAGFPVPKAAPALAAESNKFLWRVLAGGAKDAGQGVKLAAAAAGAEATAGALEDTIEKGAATTLQESKDRLKKYGSNAVLPSAASFFAGGAASRFGGAQINRATREANLQRAREAGVKEENLTLAHAEPRFAPWQNRLTESTPELKDKVGRAMGDITSKFEAMVTSPETNAQVLEKLKPLIEPLRKARAEYDAALEMQQTAQKNFDRASEALVIPTPEQQKLFAESSVSVLNTINAKARALYEAEAALGGVLPDNSMAAEAVTEIVSDLWKTQQNIGKNLYRNSGVPVNEKLFPKSELLAAATRGMGESAQSGDAKRILDAIQDAGVDPKSPALTLDEVMSLRGRLRDIFDDKMAMQGEFKNADRLASRAYSSIGGETQKIIGETFPPDVAARYNEARKFWAESNSIGSNPLARALLKKTDVPDHALLPMANGLLSSNTDELRSYKSFIELLKGFDPNGTGDSIKLAEKTMGNALRTALINKHSTKGPTDVPALLADLQVIARREKLPLPVEMLGFGSPRVINEWASIAQELTPKQFTPRVADAVLQNPRVQEVLKLDAAESGKVLREVTAEEVYRDKVTSELIGKLSGARNLERESQQQARDFLARSNLDADRAKTILEEVQNNPFLGAFSSKSPYKLLDELGNTSDGVSKLMDTMPEASLKPAFNALRKNNPQLAGVVGQRVVANELRSMLGVETQAAEVVKRVEIPKLRAYFLTEDNPGRRRLEAAADPETLKRIRRSVELLAEVDDNLRRGRYPSTREMQTLVDAASLGAAGFTGNRPAMWMAVFQRMRDAASRGAYNLLSVALTDPEVGKKLFDPAMNLSQALGSLPAQKAYLLTNDARLQEDIQNLDGLPNWQGRPSGRQ